MGYFENKPNTNSRSSVLLVLAVSAIVLFVRKTDSFLNPQFWAEDGAIFFLQQYEKGASALLQDYAGYLHLVPRLIALVADSFFTYSAIPIVYNFSSLLFTLVVVASIFSPRLKINHKPLLALTIVLVPHYTDEVFLNVANLQWILSILLIVVLLKERPHDRYGNINVQYVLDLIIIILCGLTGPFIVFLVPFFIWKWINDKGLYDSIILIAVIAVSSIQFFFMLSELIRVQNGISFNLNVYSAIIGHKLFGNLFLTKGIAYKLNHYILSFLYFGTIFMMLRFAPPKRRFIFVCLGVQFIILLAAFYKFKANPEILIPPGNGQRYFYIPNIMLVWCLIALLEKKAKWKNALLLSALALVLISSVASGFHSKPFIDYNWNSYSKLIGKEDVVIPINPKGWHMHIKVLQK